MGNESYDMYFYVRRDVMANLPSLASGEIAWETSTKSLYIGSDTGNLVFANADAVSGKTVIGASANGILKDAGTGFGKSYQYTINSTNGTGDLTKREILLTIGDSNAAYYSGYLVTTIGSPRYDSTNNRTSWDILVTRVDGTYTDTGWGSQTVFVSYVAL